MKPLIIPSPKEITEELARQNPEALTADGFDEALVGYVYRMGLEPLALYDRDTCIAILMARDGMTEEEAEEFFSFNVDQAWMGEGTPAWLVRPEG